MEHVSIGDEEIDPYEVARQILPLTKILKAIRGPRLSTYTRDHIVRALQWGLRFSKAVSLLRLQQGAIEKLEAQLGLIARVSDVEFGTVEDLARALEVLMRAILCHPLHTTEHVRWVMEFMREQDQECVDPAQLVREQEERIRVAETRLRGCATERIRRQEAARLLWADLSNRCHDERGHEARRVITKALERLYRSTPRDAEYLTDILCHLLAFILTEEEDIREALVSWVIAQRPWRHDPELLARISGRHFVFFLSYEVELLHALQGHLRFLDTCMTGVSLPSQRDLAGTVWESMDPVELSSELQERFVRVLGESPQLALITREMLQLVRPASHLPSAHAFEGMARAWDLPNSSFV